MKRYLMFFVLAVALMVNISSCKDDNNLDELRAEELRMLDDYINSSALDFVRKPSGLYFVKTFDGGNDSIISLGDEVQVYYTGRFLRDSVIFDSNVDSLGRKFDPLEFFVGTTEIISGMNEGMTYMKAGDKATLVIPSNLGYGAINDLSRGIPRFSTLIFDVEVHSHVRLEDLQ